MTAPPRQPPAAVAQMLAVMEAWRDRLNGSKRAAAWVSESAVTVSHHKNRWVLSIEITYATAQKPREGLPEDESGG